ncbi:MAG: 6-bladed beta-propeller [Acidobacteriota bacterium]|nr:6-bladed beta-propeller [Acidobacteriota bacterium]
MRRTCLVFCLIFAACGDRPPAQSNRQVAGIPIRTVYFDYLYDGDVDDAPVGWRMTHNIESSGQVIYVNSHSHSIMAFDSDGSYLGEIGTVGKGPGEYGPIRPGMSAGDGSLWLLGRYRLFHFKNHVHAKTLTLPHLLDGTIASSPSSDNFDISNRGILVPIKTRHGDIAALLNFEGEVLVRARDPRFDDSLLELSRVAKNGLWQYHEGIWYCVYTHVPRVLMFNEDLVQLGEYTIKSPAVDLFKAKWREEGFKAYGTPLFFTFRIHKGKGYVSTQPGLHRFDLDTGRVERIYQFRTDSVPMFDHIKKPMSMFLFTILEDGRLVLSNGIPSKLWITRGPI